jgi:hypothetical protein
VGAKERAEVVKCQSSLGKEGPVESGRLTD